MLKIGEFSKLSMLTVKALRFYDSKGLLQPAATDETTGYRQYETWQLRTAAKVKALRQLGFSVAEVKAYIAGQPLAEALDKKALQLKEQQVDLQKQLCIIKYLLEDKEMKYQAVLKDIDACVVYSEERRLENFSKVVELILSSAEECERLNPGIECAKPDYCFCEYLDGEYRDKDIMTRYSQAVVKGGIENERIKFRALPATKVLSIYHKGPFERIGEAYAYIVKYAKDNGYKISGCPRECYIDGMWNKDDPEDWLTEIQLPVEK